VVQTSNKQWIARNEIQAADRLEGRDRAGDESRLHLEHGVIDRRSEAFVQDLDPEEFRGSGGAVFVGRGDRDVKGQSLIGVPGESRFLEALDFGERDVVELIDGGVDRHGDITGEGGVEDSRGIGGEVEILLELGTDVVFVA
jgi:hypothetical protein